MKAKELNINNMPSIFNDVIGPVMRGPSSSHTAASWRIAKLSLELLNDTLKNATISFDINGAWASNYREQGTEMGINAGLLGLEITDPQMKDTSAFAEKLKIPIIYKIDNIANNHPNTVKLLLEGIEGKKIEVLAVSLGGGSFEIQKINDFNISLKGDYFEGLIFINNANKIEQLKSSIPQKLLYHQSINDKNALVSIKSSSPISNGMIDKIKKLEYVDEIRIVNPILPIISGNETIQPFKSIVSLIEYSQKENLSLGKIGLIYEKHRSGLADEELLSKMGKLVQIINDSIKTGLKGTVYNDRILPQQSDLIKKAEAKGKILQNTLVNNTIAFVTAIMESKSAMEVIVANPTAGSCGTIGGVLKAVADDIKASEKDLLKAYFAAGIVGVYFANGPGFSAEEHGCQVECGAASGMSAAGIAQLMGGTAKQSLDAASMAIQNMIGLVCDPVADRVEVPCLGKNISAAMNALSSATMVCSGFDAIIPLNEVIETVSRVSLQMPTCVKCTGKGGLAITPTSIKIKQQFKG